MKTLNVSISFEEDRVPIFDNAHDQAAYYQALGRMVDYGIRSLANATANDLALLNLTLEARAPGEDGITPKGSIELTGVYYKPQRSYAVKTWSDTGAEYHSYWDGPGAPLDAARQALIDAAREAGHPFVMGGIQHSDGSFSYHS